MEVENSLITGKHLLYVETDLTTKLDYLVKNFCGKVIHSFTELASQTLDSKTNVYLTGNIGLFDEFDFASSSVYIVDYVSSNYEKFTDRIIKLGQVPINLHNVGVYFRSWFSDSVNWFENIGSEHEFQTLTESTKESNAFRKGIYYSSRAIGFRWKKI